MSPNPILKMNDLKPDRDYRWRVVAINKCGKSVESDVAPPMSEPPFRTNPSVPSAPVMKGSTHVASVDSKKYIIVNWLKAGPNRLSIATYTCTTL